MYKLNYLQQNSPEKLLFKKFRRISSYDGDIECFYCVNQYLDLIYSSWYRIYNEE